MFVVREKWAETWTDCYIDPSSSSPIAALLSHHGWGRSTVGHWGQQRPQSASWFSFGHPVSNWLEPPRASCYIISYRPHASTVLPLIYTGASLDWRLGRGSIYNKILDFGLGVTFFVLLGMLLIKKCLKLILANEWILSTVKKFNLRTQVECLRGLDNNYDIR